MTAEESDDVFVLEALVMPDFAFDLAFFFLLVFLLVDFDLIRERF